MNWCQTQLITADLDQICQGFTQEKAFLWVDETDAIISQWLQDWRGALLRFLYSHGNFVLQSFQRVKTNLWTVEEQLTQVLFHFGVFLNPVRTGLC